MLGWLIDLWMAMMFGGCVCVNIPVDGQCHAVCFRGVW